MEPTIKDPDELLTVQEVAAVAKVHVETVRRWIRAGDLPAKILGGNRTGYRIVRRDLTAFLERMLRDQQAP